MKLSAVFRRSHIQPWPVSDVCPGEREKFPLIIYPLQKNIFGNRRKFQCALETREFKDACE